MSMAFAVTWHRFLLQLGWVVLGHFGVPGAEGSILCSCLCYLAPLGYQGIRHGLFWCTQGLVGVSPAHCCLSLWAVRCVLGAVNRDVGLCSVLLSTTLLFCYFFLINPI